MKQSQGALINTGKEEYHEENTGIGSDSDVVPDER